jgi:hypothetical protein
MQEDFRFLKCLLICSERGYDFLNHFYVGKIISTVLMKKLHNWPLSHIGNYLNKPGVKTVQATSNLIYQVLS